MFNKTKTDGPEDTLLDPTQMICCHTPLRERVSEFQDKYVLVTGNGSVLSVCQEYGFKKAIHVEELFALMPQLSPLLRKE